jgi:RNA polymerase sigma factor (sigma-70 family)
LSIEKDKALVGELLKGDTVAWDRIGACISTWLRSASQRHYIPDDEMDDLRQEILEKLVENDYRKLQQFSFRCRLSSWIGSIVNNHLYDRYKTEIRKEVRDRGFESFRLVVSDQETGNERLLEKLSDIELVEKALESLSSAEREIIKLFYWDGLITKDIAKITGDMPSTITAKLVRARGKMKDFLMEKTSGKGDKVI